jgi:DNA primase
MSKLALIHLLESVLGKGQETARNNIKFHCPFCKHHKPKLEISLITNAAKENFWHCWFCHKKGTTIESLFKKLKVFKAKKEELEKIIKPNYKEFPQEAVEELALPKEFTSLRNNSSSSVFASNYLIERGITNDDILKYNLGYCDSGPHQDRIIIPSYNGSGELNYFIARSYNPFLPKYKNPKVSKDIIAFEFFINWNMPIILCEGVFDAMAIKRNAIPLLGTTISKELMKKIVTSKVKKIYIALDSDAMKLMLKYAEQLINNNKEVYLVRLDDKDPSQLGFEKFTKTIQNTQPLTFQDLLTIKLQQ